MTKNLILVKIQNDSDGYQKGIASMIYKVFDKKYSPTLANNCAGGGVTRVWSKTLPMRDKSAIENKIVLYQQLAEGLHKQITRKFDKRKKYSSFKINILAADLSDMQLMRKYHNGFHFLLCVIDIYNNYHCSFKSEKRYYNY